MTLSSRNKRELAKFAKDYTTELQRRLQAEARRRPIRVPIETEARPDRGVGYFRPFAAGAPYPQPTTTATYNGPVIYQTGDGNFQVAVGGRVNQEQHRIGAVAAGYEQIAELVAEVLERLPDLGLDDADVVDADDAGRTIVDEVTKEQPDKGRIRRSLKIITATLTPIATGLVTGAATGVREWAQRVVEHLTQSLH